MSATLRESQRRISKTCSEGGLVVTSAAILIGHSTPGDDDFVCNEFTVKAQALDGSVPYLNTVFPLSPPAQDVGTVEKEVVGNLNLFDGVIFSAGAPQSEDKSTSTAVTVLSEAPMAPRVVRLPQSNSEPECRYDVRQKWEGVVKWCTETEFGVVLRDLTHPNAPDEEVTLSLDEVSSEDIPLLQPGAVLYWSIGYEISRGQKKRVSTIRFRRQPAWSRREVLRVKERAKQLKEFLGIVDAN